MPGGRACQSKKKEMKRGISTHHRRRPRQLPACPRKKK
ncbi:hypothetical protein B4166_3748 [Caldibacillus thermoamylovorans]|uniref:Uncharacterized protein n=1 Tax=Caldibacillus thermoamylovorans TaxID=35841 RepID=A0ABD4A7R5_9BACI|nr:hypothetical protein B4166_3748 [Caldibacillus thermoamylovorans]KIO73046.1 hypothetical protein B4167_2503 [Caldibacillus thermoamylovorans]